MAYSLTYTYNSATSSYSVTGWNNITENDVVIVPDTYSDGVHGTHPVTSIQTAAFIECTTLKSILISDNVIDIGLHTFGNCTNLAAVRLPKNLTKISAFAFADCDSLSTIEIPDAMTVIGAGAFQSCNALTTVVIPHNVEEVGQEAFSDCSRLTNVIITSSVLTKIWHEAFLRCRNLANVIMLVDVPPVIDYSTFATYGDEALVPLDIAAIYVPEAAENAYKTATNWNSFADKIQSNNTYLSLIRFNENNKKYIAEKITSEASNVIPNIMSEQPLGFRGLVGQTRKTVDDTIKTSIYTIASENAAIVPDRIPWYRAPGNPDNIAEQPTATLPVSDPVWEFDAVNKKYADRKVDNDTDRIRCGDLYVAGAMGLIQAKRIQNPSRGDGVTVNDKLKVLIAPTESDDVVRKEELDTKLDKAGGTISGSLIIAENLTVQGKTTSVDTQNLKVADKLIYVAKDNTVALTSPAGIITPKYDGTNNGGIVYDSTGTAYVGDVALDSNGNVDVNSSDLQPIATRDTTITDGNIVKWDNAAKKLVDSGKAVNDLSTATNIANGTGDVLVQTTDSNQSFKVMTDGRAKVQSAPIEDDDVVRKQELDSVKIIANNAVVANSTITAGTHTKITYDSKGLVTGGTELAASDIPNLSASKITGGTFSDDRIASASVWNAKLDSSEFSVLTQSQVDSLF